MRRARSGTAVAALLLLAGCSGSSTPATTPQTITLTEQEQRGKQLFVSSCGPCHSLADAGTHGSAGPGLDDHPWRTVTVREVIASGPRLMPAELVTGADADAVAAYVAAATRR